MAYQDPTVTDYNDSPPSDDGAKTLANKISWAGIKAKLAQPLYDAIGKLINNQPKIWIEKSALAIDYAGGTYVDNVFASYTPLSATSVVKIIVSGLATTEQDIPTGDSTIELGLLIHSGVAVPVFLPDSNILISSNDPNNGDPNMIPFTLMGESTQKESDGDFTFGIRSGNGTGARLQVTDINIIYIETLY